MTASLSPFAYPAPLDQFAVSEKEYLSQHQDVHIICTGAVVFNNEGKLLLVQRAKEEKAFPNVWVSCILVKGITCAWSGQLHVHLVFQAAVVSTVLIDIRRSRVERWTILMRPFYTQPHAN